MIICCRRLLIISLLLLLLGAYHCQGSSARYTRERLNSLKQEVRGMFLHAYEGYLNYAEQKDELRPLTCDGSTTWFPQLSLIDAMSTIAVMGNFSEFRRVALIIESMEFDKDINVSVFETNIRILGGLLSTHLLTKRAGMELEPGWPCEGPLLRLAEDVARRLLPAFDTATGMPYGTVNLKYGVPKGETAITCVAGVGTFLVEFGTLSRLTGNPIYEEVALNALYALWSRRSALGLFGNHIDVQTGRWTALDSGIGAGVDSLFEYLVKGALLLERPELLQMFHEARAAIDAHLKKEDWYVWVNMNKGHVTLPVFQSLEAFWPGILSMIGDIGPAMRTFVRYANVWKQYGFLPEFYNIPTGEASTNRESYPLRPELIESAMYLYRITKNEYLLELGEQMLRSIEFSAKTKCGYATIRNVVTHEKENRMESFFLAETTKYLYLLFDEDNFLHADGTSGNIIDTPHGKCVIDTMYIFNTEAHPVDMAALSCCHQRNDDIFEGLNLDEFSDANLLRMERLHIEQNALDLQQECSNFEATPAAAAAIPKPATTGRETKFQHGNLTVDIEVFDEDNNPAGDILVDNFDRIKSEKQAPVAPNAAANRAGLDASAAEMFNAVRNQLTVTDLEEFFTKQRSDFKSDQQVLNYIIHFMCNFTLDGAFISGLQLFNKTVASILGDHIQKEFEGSMHNLWSLYEKQQRYAANVAFVEGMGLLNFEEENNELLTDIVKAFSADEQLEPTQDNPNINAIRSRLHTLHTDYEISLLNSTAMQEFLLKILINGSSEKKRKYVPLLQSQQYLQLELPSTARKASMQHYQLFASARRIIQLKKRLVDTMQQLQLLMQHVNISANDSSSNEVFGQPSPEALSIQAATNINMTGIDFNDSQSMFPQSDELVNVTLDTSAEVSESNESVWSQLLHTILRKASLERSKFDEEALLRKTRRSLQQYQRKNIPLTTRIFSCQQPKFIDRFAYRDFHP